MSLGRLLSQFSLARSNSSFVGPEVSRRLSSRIGYPKNQHPQTNAKNASSWGGGMTPPMIKTNAQSPKENQVNRPIRVPERFIIKSFKSSPTVLPLLSEIENAARCPIPSPRRLPLPLVPSGKFFALSASMCNPMVPNFFGYMVRFWPTSPPIRCPEPCRHVSCP